MTFTPNINGTGRVLRVAWGLLMAALAWWFYASQPWVTALCALFAVVGFFQAARGWCFVRACGIRTRW